MFKNEWKGWLLILLWPLLVGILGAVVLAIVTATGPR
jgi:hypothetical protein